VAVAGELECVGQRIAVDRRGRRRDRGPLARGPIATGAVLRVGLELLDDGEEVRQQLFLR
jgi:hypothetical protein